MAKDFSTWTLVFDLDGTLVETAPDLHAALNHTLAAQDLGPIPISEIRSMIGDGAKALIRKGLSWHNRDVDEDQLDAEHWPLFLDHYLANICRLSHLYDGAGAALSELSEAGATLAVCTNKAQTLAEEVLKGLGLASQFAAIVGGDTVPSKKPDGQHIVDTIDRAGGHQSRAIMIGDSHTDERAASHARLPFVFVPFGYGKRLGLQVPAFREVAHWDDMPAALRDIIAGT